MAEQFFIADPHFSHQGVCEFTGKNGGPLRPWNTYEEMDEELVRRWNAVVPATGAKVYVLGDVAMNVRALAILDRLNGKKKLIKGNHDIYKVKDYLRYFYEIDAYKVTRDLIFSHIPIHEESLKQRWKANVHGHLHDGRVMTTVRDVSGYGTTRLESDYETINPRYLCVSVEHTNYAPISMDEVYERIREQQR